MVSTFLTVALFIATALQGALAEFAVSTPELVQCGQGHVGWQPTTGPYNIFLVDPADPCGDEIAHLGETGDTWLDWTVAVAAGTAVQVYIEDSAGDDAWSGAVTVGESSDSSCLDAAAGGAAAAATSTHASTSSPTVAPIGAANAGNNPLGNAASSVRQINTPMMALGAIAAFVAVAL